MSSVNCSYTWSKISANFDIDPLLMNAFNGVNLAAASILTSTEYAEELGIPESKWIYPLGGAGTQDSNLCTKAILSDDIYEADPLS